MKRLLTLAALVAFTCAYGMKGRSSVSIGASRDEIRLSERVRRRHARKPLADHRRPTHLREMDIYEIKGNMDEINRKIKELKEDLAKKENELNTYKAEIRRRIELRKRTLDKAK